MSEEGRTAALVAQALAAQEQARQTGMLNDNYARLVAAESAPKPDHAVWLEALVSRTTGSNSLAASLTFADQVLAAYKQRFPRQLPPESP